jgi:pyruvate dehydrogenase E2 component (dihydrolipoamide acetyltransferase)
MIYKVIVPDLGATGSDMTLTAWLVKPNDFVAAGSALFAVTTDKADMEVEAFRDGYIREILANVGSRVSVGTVVAILADSLEEPIADVLSSQTESESPHPHRSEAMMEGPGYPQQQRSTESPESGRVVASPLARRLAREMGIDLASVFAKSKSDKVQSRDVLNVASGSQGPQRLSEVAPPSQHVARRIPVSPMRKAIAERTKLSMSDAPHYYMTAVVDVSDTLKFLEQAGALCLKTGSIKPSLTDVALQAVAMTLRRVPQLNARFHGDEIVQFDEVNIGIVLALDEGIIVPVVSGADQKSLYALAATRRQLQEKGKAGKLSNKELAGSTFTVSNLGSYGVESFTAVINPPEAAILALGTARKRPSVYRGKIAARDEMIVTLSVDHRLVDGVAAAQFLNELKSIMENPASLALDSTTTHSL